MDKKWGNIVKFVIFLGVGLFFVYWFLLKLDPDTKQSIWRSVQQADYWWVGAAMLVSLLALFVRALRWQLLYEPLGQTPRLRNTFGAVLVAYLANLAFPRLGEVLRCAVLTTSDDIPIEKSLGTMISERCVDVAAYLLIVLIGVLVMFSDLKTWFGEGFADRFSGSSWATLLLAAALILIIAASVWIYIRFRERLTHYRIIAKIDQLLTGCLEGVKSILHLQPRKISAFIIYSIIIYLCYILGGLIIFQAFPETAGLGFNAAFVAYLFASVGMVISQGGIGAHPALFQKALALYGVPLAAGNACGWVLWTSQQVIIILLGLAFVLYFALLKKKSKAAGADYPETTTEQL